VKGVGRGWGGVGESSGHARQAGRQAGQAGRQLEHGKRTTTAELRESGSGAARAEPFNLRLAARRPGGRGGGGPGAGAGVGDSSWPRTASVPRTVPAGWLPAKSADSP
jgi:hypothetical protein